MASQRRALDLTRHFHLEVEYWPILDPTGLGETREAKLAAYRQTRDQIAKRMTERFGATQVRRLRVAIAETSGQHGVYTYSEDA